MKLVGNTVVVVLVVLGTLVALPFLFVFLLAFGQNIATYFVGGVIIVAAMMAWTIFVEPGMKAKEEARVNEERRLAWEKHLAEKANQVE